jgi:hypothetical protein
LTEFFERQADMMGNLVSWSGAEPARREELRARFNSRHTLTLGGADYYKINRIKGKPRGLDTGRESDIGPGCHLTPGAGDPTLPHGVCINYLQAQEAAERACATAERWPQEEEKEEWATVFETIGQILGNHEIGEDISIVVAQAKLGLKLRGAAEGTPPRPLLGALFFGMTEKYQLLMSPGELRRLQERGSEAVRNVVWAQFSGIVLDRPVVQRLRSLQDYHTKAGIPPAEVHQRGTKGHE